MSNAEKVILACIDGSSITKDVVEHAAFWAKKIQVPLVFLNIVEQEVRNKKLNHQGVITPNNAENLLESLSEQEYAHMKGVINYGKELLEQAKEVANEAGQTDVELKQIQGDLTSAIAQMQLDYELEFVFVGASGVNSESKAVLGSQLEVAIRQSETPVYVVKSAFQPPKSLLFLYKGSLEGKRALIELSKGTLFEPDIALHIVSMKKERKVAQLLINEALATLENSPYKNINTEVLVTTNPEQLLRYQRDNDIDITMMNAFRHSTLYGFLFGSFTNNVLLASKSNFIIVR